MEVVSIRMQKRNAMAQLALYPMEGMTSQGQAFLTYGGFPFRSRERQRPGLRERAKVMEDSECQASRVSLLVPCDYR